MLSPLIVANKCSQWKFAAPEYHEIDLQLSAGLGFESLDWRIGWCKPNLAYVLLELPNPAVVAFSAISRN
ncbi:MAG TPA: hypothetical protein VKR56_12715 [Candidatus Cybelea sp.]|nr:hypothetical protein [Candidatus Cybelea sp.]